MHRRSKTPGVQTVVIGLIEQPDRGLQDLHDTLSRRPSAFNRYCRNVAISALWI